MKNLPTNLILILVAVTALVSCTLFDENNRDFMENPLPSNKETINIVAYPWGSICVFTFTELEIGNLQVIINGSDVFMVRRNADYALFEGDYPFEPNQCYTIDVNINDTKRQVVDLTMVCEPELSIPDSLEIGIYTEITWSLDCDAQTQMLLIENFVDTDSVFCVSDLYSYLPVEQRDFTFNGEMVSYSGDTNIRVSITEYNWIQQGDFYFISYNADTEEFTPQSSR